ncbi:Transcription initiation factor TFIID subunit 13 [Allomyces javanicus]|nr:Transcription initiation factor TFIID subunit 13 [Allomyces javanicus]
MADPYDARSSAGAAGPADRADRDRPHGPTSTAGTGKNATSSLRAVAAKNKGVFTNELKEMLWTHGDPGDPDPATLDLLEDIALEFMVDLSVQAHRLSANKSRLRLDDLRFLLRHDPIHLGRLEEILTKDEQLRRAKALASADVSDVARQLAPESDAEDAGAAAAAAPMTAGKGGKKKGKDKAAQGGAEGGMDEDAVLAGLADPMAGFGGFGGLGGLTGLF